MNLLKLFDSSFNSTEDILTVPEKKAIVGKSKHSLTSSPKPNTF
jgi:hypothetical protein